MRKISRLAYELIVGEVLGKSACASRKESQGGGCRFGGCQIFRTRAGNYAILPNRQFNSFAFIALLARVKPGKFQRRAAIRWMRPTGRISFRDFSKGFSRASLGIRQGIAPSLSPPTRSRGRKGTSLWTKLDRTRTSLTIKFYAMSSKNVVKNFVVHTS